MKWVKIVAIMIAVLMLVGCEKKLTRADAEQILNNNNFGITKTFSLNMVAIESNPVVTADLLALVKKGFISLDPPNEYMNFNVNGVVLKDPSDIVIAKESMCVVLARCNHFVVDGIEKVSDTECIVQASRDLTITAAGQAMGFREAKGFIVKYEFHLFDDGWRVTSYRTGIDGVYSEVLGG